MHNKKLLFYEVCDGDLARQVQVEFEKAQSLSLNSNCKTEIKVKLVVHPPEGGTGRFGGFSFEIVPATVKKVSMKYTTELDEKGIIIGDGKSITDVLQEELRFEPDNNIPFTLQKGTE